MKINNLLQVARGALSKSVDPDNRGYLLDIIEEIERSGSLTRIIDKAKGLFDIDMSSVMDLTDIHRRLHDYHEICVYCNYPNGRYEVISKAMSGCTVDWLEFTASHLAILSASHRMLSGNPVGFFADVYFDGTLIHSFYVDGFNLIDVLDSCPDKWIEVDSEYTPNGYLRVSNGLKYYQPGFMQALVKTGGDL